MEDFEKLYVCNFDTSEFDRLVDEIVKFNKATEHMSKKDSAHELKRLTVWRARHGYSSQDYQQAKNIANGIRH